MANENAIRYENAPAKPVRFHEYATLFPMMAGEELDRLREDIRETA